MPSNWYNVKFSTICVIYKHSQVGFYLCCTMHYLALCTILLDTIILVLKKLCLFGVECSLATAFTKCDKIKTDVGRTEENHMFQSVQ
jgi:hypothetical protein